MNEAPRRSGHGGTPGGSRRACPALLVTVALALCLGSSGCLLRESKGALPPPLAVDEGWSVARGVTYIPQRSLADCGAAALAMVLGAWLPAPDGRGPVGEDQVRAWLGPISATRGVEAGRLRDVARARGLAAFVIEGTADDLARELTAGRPVIAGVVNVAGGSAFPHYEVVVGLNRARNRVLTADPAIGWRQETLAAFDQRWKLSRRLALVVLRPEAKPEMSTARAK